MSHLLREGTSAVLSTICARRGIPSHPSPSGSFSSSTSSVSCAFPFVLQCDVSSDNCLFSGPCVSFSVARCLLSFPVLLPGGGRVAMIYRSGVDAPTAQIQYTNVTDREANIFGYIRNPSLGSCIDRVLSQSAFLLVVLVVRFFSSV